MTTEPAPQPAPSAPQAPPREDGVEHGVELGSEADETEPPGSTDPDAPLDGGA